MIDGASVATLAACDLARLSMSYLELFNKNITSFCVVSERVHQRTLIDCRGFAHGMQANMPTRHGIRIFLDACRHVRRPIDDELDLSWAQGVQNIAVFPFSAFERHGPSTIGLARYEAHAVPVSIQMRRLALRVEEKWRRGTQRIGGYGYGRVMDIDEGGQR